MGHQRVLAVVLAAVQTAGDELAAGRRQLGQPDGPVAVADVGGGDANRSLLSDVGEAEVRGRGTFVAEAVHESQLVRVEGVGPGASQAASRRSRRVLDDGRRDQVDGRRRHVLHRSARPRRDRQVLFQHVNDIAVVPAAGDVQLLGCAAGFGSNPDEHAVQRIVDDRIAADLRPDPVVIRGKCDPLMPRRVEIRLLETVRTGRHRGVGAARDDVERDRGPRVGDVDRIDDRGDRVDQHAAAAVADVGVVHVIQEDPFLVVHEIAVGAVDVVAEHDPAPIARCRDRVERVGIQSDLLVVVRREIHATGNRPILGIDDAIAVGIGAQDVAAGVLQNRRSQNLQRAAAAVDARGRTAHADARPPHLEDGVGVDHHRHALGNFQRRAVRQGRAQAAVADLVGEIVVDRLPATIGPGIADDPDNVSGTGTDRRTERRGDVVERRRFGAGAAVGGRLVHENRAGAGSRRRSAGQVRCRQRRGAVEPEIEDAARHAVPVGVQERRRTVRIVGVEDRVLDRIYVPAEIETQIVLALRRAAETSVLDDRIVLVVAAGADSDIVRAFAQIQFQVGIPAEVVVVAGQQFVRSVGIEPVQRQYGVQAARLHLPLGHGLGRKLARHARRHVEPEQVDVLALRVVQMLQMDQVVIAVDRRFQRIAEIQAGIKTADRQAGQILRRAQTQQAAHRGQHLPEPTVLPRHRIPEIEAVVQIQRQRQQGLRQVLRAVVCRRDDDPVPLGLDELDSDQIVQRLQRLAGPAFLRLGDQIERRLQIAVRILQEADVLPEIVLDPRDADVHRPRGAGVGLVALQMSEDVPMPRIVVAAGQLQRVDLRIDHAPHHVVPVDQRLGPVPCDQRRQVRGRVKAGT